MWEFVFGKDQQFAALDRELCEGKNYKFPNRRLPDSCTPSVACLTVGKRDEVYYLYIDKGVSTTSDNDEFRTFLERGCAMFICMDDMAEFLRSLRPLFAVSERLCEASSESREHQGLLQAGSTDSSISKPIDDIVDIEGVHEILKSEDKPKFVSPEDIAEKLKEKVFGQDEVIDALSDKIVINKMRKTNKLLVVAFLGPTGTGKSEAAKNLAETLTEVYGTTYGYIEIAGNEFRGEHTIHRFFGAPPGYVGHGQPTLLDPVRNNPYFVIVINEVEKADDSFLTGLMEAIDTGRVGMADNTKPIDLNRCIMIFTSNLPIDMEKYRVSTAFDRAEMCRHIFTKHCGRPEISGKIGNFLAFEPLSVEARIKIFTKFAKEELESFDVKLVSIDTKLAADFLKHESDYGARGIMNLVSDSVGRHLLRTSGLERFKGKGIVLKGTIENIELETA